MSTALPAYAFMLFSAAVFMHIKRDRPKNSILSLPILHFSSCNLFTGQMLFPWIPVVIVPALVNTCRNILRKVGVRCMKYHIFSLLLKADDEDRIRSIL